MRIPTNREGGMDINYFLHREQVERSRADRAASPEAKAAHSRMADLYRARIQNYRSEAAALFARDEEAAPARPSLVRADR